MYQYGNVSRRFPSVLDGRSPKMKPQLNEDILDVSSQLPRSRSGEKPSEDFLLCIESGRGWLSMLPGLRLLISSVYKAAQHALPRCTEPQQTPIR